MTAGEGASGAPAPQVRTFLFTDLEDNSSLWEEDPAAMAEAVGAHDRLLGELIAACGGTVVKSTGDGLMAVFDDATAAVGAARTIQDRIAATTWPIGPVRARIGVHVGPGYERDGDWFGPAVNLAARLCDAAHGGQVVASEPVAHIVRDERWVDLGEHRFRGVRRPERVQQLDVGDRDEFPALRKVEQGTDRLPHPASSFVGREAELAEALDALRAERLVTLTAIGGGGKTRLAVEVARALLPDLADGADFVDLAPVGDDAAVAAAIAAALHLDRDDTDSRAPLVRVLSHCHTKQLLLVVDNCEHLLEGAGAAVEAILEDCPDLRVLATSREPLHVPGERVVPVPSLAGGSAVELFRARATSATGEPFSDEDLPAVREVCRRLDGIPLAIELAAARTAHLTVGEVAARLDDRFRLLTGGNRRLQRQQTLQATLDWTHDLLADEEQALLRRLAVFAGWFRLERVESLWGGDALDLLAALVERSMVVHDHRRGRYRLLETVRLYAELQLLAAGEADGWRTRHRDVFAALVSTPPLEAVVHLSATSRALVEDHADLRAALRWSMDRGDWVAAAELAHRLPAIAHLAGDVDLTDVLVAIAGHLDRGSEHAFLCSLSALVSLSTRNERVSVDTQTWLPDDGAAGVLRGVAELGRTRSDDLGIFTLAMAGFNLIGLGLIRGEPRTIEDGRTYLDLAVAAIGDRETTMWTSYVLGIEGILLAAGGDADRAMPLLRRATGIDGGARNDDYLAVYALFSLRAGDPDALAHAWHARQRAGYGFARISALLALTIGEADRGNVEVARDELAASAPEYERSGPALRAGYVLAAAVLARHEGAPERSARWIGACDSVGVEKGPHVRFVAEWQVTELSGDFTPEALDEIHAVGRSAGVDAALDEVVAWLEEPRDVNLARSGGASSARARRTSNARSTPPAPRSRRDDGHLPLPGG